MDLMKGYPYKLTTDNGFTASFGSFKDAVGWFELGAYNFATVQGATKGGDYIYIAELENKDGNTEIWKAYK